MKCYKAYLKKDFVDKNNLHSPIFIYENDLDILIAGESIQIESTEDSVKLYYSDLTMITTCE